MKTPEPMANAAPNAFLEPPPIGQNRQYTCSASVNKGRGSLMVDGEIGWWGVTSKMVRDRLDEIGNVSDIDVVINSPGGLIGEGVAIYNALKRHSANIHVSIEGYALSMGSIIAMAGDTVSMADNSLMMIHNPIGGAWGDAETLRKEAEVLDKHKSALVTSYTSRPQVTLSEDEVIDAMNAETWYTAAEARAVGLVDEVIETGDDSVNTYAAQLPHAAVQNAPQWVHQIRDRAVAMSVKPPVSTGTTTPREEDMNIAAARPAAGADPVATETAVTVNVDQERKDAVAAERTRAAGIRSAFAKRIPNAKASVIDRYIESGESVEAVERVITDLLELGADTTPVGGDAHVMADERDKTREGMLSALMARTGNKKYKRDPQNEFNGLTLFEMAGESLRRAGVKPDSSSKRDRVGAAFTHTTTDFPSVLTDVVRRTVMDAYRERPESFEEFTRAVNLPDFRPAKRVGMLELDELDLRPEGAEYKHKSLSEFYEMISLDTYGNKVGITREAIINDDLGLLTDIPTKMGRMARRTIAAKVFNVFSANPLMADGAALFHSSHGNLAGAGAILSTASVDAALTAMATNMGRYSANDSMQPLNVVPDILLVPMALRARAMTVMEAEYKVHAGATDTNRDPNTVRNAMRVVADPRLDAISTTAWYLIDSTNMPIERAFLDGEQEPYIDSVRGWDIDGTEFKIRLDLGVAPVEYSTIYKQPGA
jgi:ATP-dependent Clp endopeptidase proteolytic subunit ClpP